VFFALTPGASWISFVEELSSALFSELLFPPKPKKLFLPPAAFAAAVASVDSRLFLLLSLFSSSLICYHYYYHYHYHYHHQHYYSQ